MKCPKCEGVLEAHIVKHKEDEDYIEVEIYCAVDNLEDEHCYFVRIREDDLIEL